MNWPDDLDGDVFRRMEASGFDFTKEYTIDFNIDFKSWPLDESTKKSMLAMYPSCDFIDPEEGDTSNGYVQFKIVARPTHELVVSTQKQVSDKLEQFGGWCESWGVLQD